MQRTSHATHAGPHAAAHATHGSAHATHAAHACTARTTIDMKHLADGPTCWSTQLSFTDASMRMRECASCHAQAHDHTLGTPALP